MSKSISEIDKNLAVETVCNLPIVFRNATEEPFSIHGLLDPHDGAPYHRIPDGVAAATNDGVKWLNYHTSGGRVRFKTSSPHLAIKVKLSGVGLMPHMTLVGTAGLDVYLGGYEGYPGGYRYHASCMTEGGNDAAIKMTNNHGYTNMVWLPTEGMKDVLLNLPLYGGIDELWIGLSPDATVEAADPYRDLLPTVYYGSSITQGACASRAGNTYPNILSRKFNFDYLNLGFAGACKAEDAIIDYLCQLPMQMLVFDYDHNSPSPEYLRQTHLPALRKLRKAHPDIPMVLLSKPNIHTGREQAIERMRIVEESYEALQKESNAPVHFVNGQEIYESCDSEMMTIDGTHPTDLGFYCMAKALAKVFQLYF